MDVEDGHLPKPCSQRFRNSNRQCWTRTARPINDMTSSTGAKGVTVVRSSALAPDGAALALSNTHPPAESASLDGAQLKMFSGTIGGDHRGHRAAKWPSAAPMIGACKINFLNPITKEFSGWVGKTPIGAANHRSAGNDGPRRSCSSPVNTTYDPAIAWLCDVSGQRR